MEYEWVSVEEDTPQISPRYKNLTNDVYVKFSDGTIGVGYFNYRDYCWYSCESKRYPDEVTGWSTM